MNLSTIVEDYVIAAIKHSAVELSGDGTVGAYVPELPGVAAFGADVHECARNLYVHIEEWIRTALSRGYRLPVLDGIDLSADASSILESYHRDRESAEGEGAFFPNEAALQVRGPPGAAGSE